MRRFLTILTLVATLATLPLGAQEGLHINALFGDRYKNRADATEVLLKGRQIRDYGLTLFRSISLPGNTVEARQIETLVGKDAAGATDKEAGMKGGRLYYGFYRLKPKEGKLNRYIFYRNNALKDKAKPTLTLIYMEGTASIEQLRQRFGRND